MSALRQSLKPCSYYAGAAQCAQVGSSVRYCIVVTRQGSEGLLALSLVLTLTSEPREVHQTQHLNH